MQREDIIYGRRPVMEMLESGIPADKIFLQRGVDSSFNARLRRLASPFDIPIQLVPLQKLNSMTRGVHQGVVALKAWVSYQKIGDAVQHVFEEGRDPVVLMLDRVTDVRNLGAIARSAEVFGVDILVLPVKDSAAINSETVKASAGALLNLSICRERSLLNTLGTLHELGFSSFAADLAGDTPIDSLAPGGPVVIIAGAEDRGIHPGLLAQVQHRFYIPQFGKTQSLNVSVACGIILFVFQKALR